MYFGRNAVSLIANLFVKLQPCPNDEVLVYHTCLNNFNFEDISFSVCGKMVNEAFNYYSSALIVYLTGNTSILFSLLFN